MTLDQAFQEVLRPLVERIEQLEHRVEVAERDLKRPVYDAQQLMDELGFSHHGAYALLRAYGTRLNGRLRISAVDLMRVYSREDDFSAPSGADPAKKKASRS